MSITASSPDAFFDGEDFAWDFIIYQDDGVTPLNLTGSRLFIRFEDTDGVVVGVCDSSAADGSLVITDAVNGKVSFLIPAAGRTWKPMLLAPFVLGLTAYAYGDLYRYPSNGAARQGVCRIDFTILPGTGPAT